MSGSSCPVSEVRHFSGVSLELPDTSRHSQLVLYLAVRLSVTLVFLIQKSKPDGSQFCHLKSIDIFLLITTSQM